MSHMYEKVVSVLSAHPNARLEKDISILVPWFKLKSELFKKLQIETLKDIIRNCEFREYEPDHVIIRQGDEGHSFYIILRGTVSIYIRYSTDEDSDDGEAEAPKDARENGEVQAKDADPNGYAEAVMTKLNRNSYGSYIRTLDSAGLSFGELALIKKSNTRNASVISDSTMHVIIVNRDLYSRSLKLSQQKDLEERTNFVDTYPLFRDWRPRYRSMLAMSLRRTTTEFNNNLVRQGEPFISLYFIMSGLAIMSTDTSLHRQQYRDKVGTAGDVRPKCSRRSLPKSYTTKSVYVAPSKIDLCVLGKGDIAGDTEAILRLPTHMQTARCIERVEAYELDLKYYEKLIHRKNPVTLNIMQRLAAIKVEHRLSRIPKEAEAPMLKWVLTRLREINTKDKMPTSEEIPNKKLNLWMTERGPLLDRTGPGSLLYRLRHVEKQLTRKRRQREQRATKSETDLQLSSLMMNPQEFRNVENGSTIARSSNAHFLNLGLKQAELPFVNIQTRDVQLPMIPQRLQYGTTSQDEKVSSTLTDTMSETTHLNSNDVSESLSGITLDTAIRRSFPLIKGSEIPSSSEEVVNRPDSRLLSESGRVFSESGLLLSESGYSSNPSNSWDDKSDDVNLLSSLRCKRPQRPIATRWDDTTAQNVKDVESQQTTDLFTEKDTTSVRSDTSRHYTVAEYSILKEALRRRQKRHSRYLESVWSPH